MLKKILPIITFALFLTSCGSETSKDRVMEIGESYSVSKGEMIVKSSPEAVVKIVHTDGKDTSTVFLIEGNATITPYENK